MTLMEASSTAVPSTDERLELLTRQVELLVADAERQRIERERWQSLVEELVHTAAKPGVGMLTDRLTELEARGYVGFARSSLGVVDKVVTSFTEEDVQALGDNVVTILNTVKEMTQPEVMGMLRRTVHTVQDEPAEPPSLLHLMKEMRDPQVRLGLSRVMQMLRSVGENPADPSPTKR
jgi:uncharacterized protein YjgD (DUF1641 family)